jgi:hypothetical protein
VFERVLPTIVHLLMLGVVPVVQCLTVIAGDVFGQQMEMFAFGPVHMDPCGQSTESGP